MKINESNGTERSTSSTPASATDSDEPDLLFGGRMAINKHDILASMPQKAVVDRLVAGYFLDRPIVPGRHTNYICTRGEANLSSCCSWPDVLNRGR